MSHRSVTLEQDEKIAVKSPKNNFGFGIIYFVRLPINKGDFLT